MTVYVLHAGDEGTLIGVYSSEAIALETLEKCLNLVHSTKECTFAFYSRDELYVTSWVVDEFV